MSDKRKSPPASNDDSAQYKRSRISYDDEDETSALPYVEKPRNDPVYGQKSAFPGLNNPSEDELFYGPADDGLEYLRMVRSEADRLPHFFTGPKHVTANEAKEEKPTGFYHDGVWVAASAPKTDLRTSAHEADDGHLDPQECYYDLLKHRFSLLRLTFKCTPPASAIAALDSSHPISFPRTSKNARAEWRILLRTVDPQMAQLACMDMETVLGLLDILTRSLSEGIKSGDSTAVRRMGAWIWGLLGKCRDVGELSSEGVGEIRELGKRAVKILTKVRQIEDSAEMQEDEDVDVDETEYRPGAIAGDGMKERDAGLPADQCDGAIRDHAESRQAIEETDAEVQIDDQSMHNDNAAQEPAESGDLDEALEAAKARLRVQLEAGYTDIVSEELEDGQLEDDEPEDAGDDTRAMLDMTITVIGEFYGQRDLLEARDIWA